ncbi:hypothetical protein GCM10011416_14670 [Polaribacter pacificus]|uniref:Uncharacterized protein n=1 Tax=Polaribacter pacificus TaxID=1775173 RepID=A0A917HYF0_9FLAO|nr:hypothetical protein [Polaribacter pacificus]GGG97693.1 hypothetical protein GCM10011416_14670 [Polaribacter pacificus]
MKRKLFILFRVLLVLILIGKVSNWFLNYSDETNQFLSTSMFTCIGFSYLAGGFIWDNRLTNIIFICCGLYLIIMNFVPDFYSKPIIGIVCILTPLIIARFTPEESEDASLIQDE